jgi:hypothetical protein
MMINSGLLEQMLTDCSTSAVENSVNKYDYAVSSQHSAVTGPYALYAISPATEYVKP